MIERPAESATTEGGLVRALGVRAVAAAVVNAIVGSGIFVLPATVAVILGPAAPIAYVACAAVVGLAVLCFAEAGSRVPKTGGAYVYVETAFGRYAGFMTGALAWLGTEVIANAAIAVVLVDAVGALLPALAGPVPRAGLIVAVFTALALVNIRGVRTGAALVQLVTLGKLVPLLVVAVAGMFAIDGANLAWQGTPALEDFGRASLVLFFAFQGGETALSPSGEIKDPTRTIPRALGLGILVVTGFYALLQFAAQGVLGPDLARNQAAPLAATAERLFGTGGLRMVGIATMISTFGTISGGMLTGPRLPFGFARDGLLPSVLGRVHPRFRTPYVAIAMHGIACAAFALSGTFKYLAVISGIATLMVYLLACLATIVLKRRDVRTDRPPFVLPGGPTIPILASLAIVWFLANATGAEFLALGVAVAVGSLIYAAAVSMRGKPPLARG